MNVSRGFEDDDLKLEMSSLIDVVFLLLIYFIVTAALIRKEADMAFKLPANVAVEDMQEIPVEALIEITADGSVIIEGMRFPYNDETLDGLVDQVEGLKEIARSQSSPFFVNVLPHKRALHRRVIDVMDACHAAGVKSLTFSKSM